MELTGDDPEVVATVVSSFGEPASAICPPGRHSVVDSSELLWGFGQTNLFHRLDGLRAEVPAWGLLPEAMKLRSARLEVDSLRRMAIRPTFSTFLPKRVDDLPTSRNPRVFDPVAGRYLDRQAISMSAFFPTSLNPYLKGSSYSYLVGSPGPELPVPTSSGPYEGMVCGNGPALGTGSLGGLTTFAGGCSYNWAPGVETPYGCSPECAGCVCYDLCAEGCGDEDPGTGTPGEGPIPVCGCNDVVNPMIDTQVYVGEETVYQALEGFVPCNQHTWEIRAPQASVSLVFGRQTPPVCWQSVGALLSVPADVRFWFEHTSCWDIRVGYFHWPVVSRCEVNFTVQPAAACINAPVTYAAIGLPPRPLRWKVNGVVEGGSSNLFNRTFTQTGLQTIRVELSGGCNTGQWDKCQHDIALTQIHPSIGIQAHPQSTTVGAGSTTTLAVQATGAQHYQWTKNGVAVGTDSPILQLTNVTPADDQTQIKVTLSNDGCPSVTSNTAVLTVVHVLSVSWVGVSAADGATNLETTSLNGGGYRLFPDKNQPGAGGSTHRRVKARATLSHPVPSGSTVDVYLKAFDVDDSTKNGANNTVDTNDTATTFVGADNRPAQPDSLENLGRLTETVSGGADFAEHEYEVTTINPGNNWKVFASTSQPEIDDIEVNPAVENGLTATNSFRRTSQPTTIPDINQQSHLLSIWRKLHVEVDSMAAEEETRVSTTLTNTVLTDSGRFWTAAQFNNVVFGEQAEWSVNPNTNQSTTFVITNTLTSPSRVVTGGNLRSVANLGDPYRIRFEAFEPGDLAQAPDFAWRGDVPMPDTGGLAEAFRPTYIEPDVTVSQGSLPWHYDFGHMTSVEDTYGSQFRSLTEESDYWVAHVIGHYENPEIDFDNDPDSDAGVGGETYNQEPEDTYIYIETLRDIARQHGWLGTGTETSYKRAVVVHEVGHHFNLVPSHSGGSTPADVMWAISNDGGEPQLAQRPLTFSDTHISQIRAMGLNSKP